MKAIGTFMHSGVLFARPVEHGRPCEINMRKTSCERLQREYRVPGLFELNATTGSPEE
jgi:hypothetical protein